MKVFLWQVFKDKRVYRKRYDYLYFPLSLNTAGLIRSFIKTGFVYTYLYFHIALVWIDSNFCIYYSAAFLFIYLTFLKTYHCHFVENLFFSSISSLIDIFLVIFTVKAAVNILEQNLHIGCTSRSELSELKDVCSLRDWQIPFWQLGSCGHPIVSMSMTQGSFHVTYFNQNTLTKNCNPHLHQLRIMSFRNIK